MELYLCLVSWLCACFLYLFSLYIVEVSKAFFNVVAIDRETSASISKEVNVQLSRIENLPSDLLREILVRVVKSPNGAFRIARIFTVSKSFQQFSEDGDVLRATSFRELSVWMSFRYPFVNEYEQFLEVGGLVAGCAIAGNPGAQFMLAKVMMISASKLLNDDSIFFNRTRTSRFVTHFLDRGILFDMIKVFISEAKVDAMKDMKDYLQDFVAWFHRSGGETDFDQFLTSLATFCNVPSNESRHLSNSIPYLVHKFNHLCTMGHSNLQKMGASEEQQQPLLRCLVHKNDHVEFETLIERLDTVVPIIALGDGIGPGECSIEVHVRTTTLLLLALNLRRELEQEVFTREDRSELMSKYHALFYM